MRKGPLFINEIHQYFVNRKLEYLYYPNGRSFIDCTLGTFSVRLFDLYRLMLGWEIGRVAIPIHEISFVVAFGSAVRMPGYTERKWSHKKYFLWGPVIHGAFKIPIEPHDADFLVVTKSNFQYETTMKPTLIESYEEGTLVTKGGIHILTASRKQFISELAAGDNFATSVFTEGVPIFIESTAALNIEDHQSWPTLLNAYWDEDKGGHLYGRIRE